jgi:hypothetical protein
LFECLCLCVFSLLSLFNVNYCLFLQQYECLVEGCGLNPFSLCIFNWFSLWLSNSHLILVDHYAVNSFLVSIALFIRGFGAWFVFLLAVILSVWCPTYDIKNCLCFDPISLPFWWLVGYLSFLQLLDKQSKLS